jgi:uncharacterized damage-inducible protein DinB
MVDLSKMFKHGLQGDFTHIHPLKALEGVTAADARSEPAAGVHSIWANLYHMLFWHKLILQTIHDPKVDWKAAQGKDWPPTTKLDDTEWNQLLDTFHKSLEEAKETLQREDLTKPIPSFPDTPIAQLMLVLAQHNSYHLGQIVVARQLLGIWPPPKDS